MLLPGRRAATAPGALRRNIAGRARCADRVPRSSRSYASRTFTTELYAQYRTGLDGPEFLAARRSCSSASVSRLRNRRTESAWPGALCARRLWRPADRGARAVSVGSGGRLCWRSSALTTATLGVPVGMIGYWLTPARPGSDLAGRPIPGRLLFDATLASVGYGLAGAAAAVAPGAPLAYLATRYPSRLSIVLERIAYLAQGVPAIVVALAFISLTVQTIRPAVPKRGAVGDRLCDPVPAVRAGRGPLGIGAGPTRA